MLNNRLIKRLTVKHLQLSFVNKTNCCLEWNPTHYGIPNPNQHSIMTSNQHSFLTCGQRSTNHLTRQAGRKHHIESAIPCDWPATLFPTDGEKLVKKSSDILLLDFFSP